MTLSKLEQVAATGGSGDGGSTFKHVAITGTGTKTTTGSMAPIDSTNLPWQTLAGLLVGQVVRLTIAGQCYASAAGDAGNTVWDFEVDRPTSANTYAGAGAPSGYAVLDFMATSRTQKRLVVDYVVGEAGDHAFRPTWYSLDGTTGKTLRNSASGADGTPIVFTAELLGTPAA